MSDTPRRAPALSLLLSLAWTALEAALLALGLGSFDRLTRDPRAIALLVLFAATGMLLSVRRPTRAQDMTEKRPDPAAMAVLFVIPLVTPMIAAFGARAALFTLPHANTVSWCGVALVAAGLFVRISAMLQLGARFSPLVSLQREHALETRGWYAVVRHPGYLGALLATLGTSLAFGSALATPLPVLMFVAQRLRIRDEEALLAERFGDEWREYARRTGALLPRPPRGR
ncbi:MAG: isoprenylcysteine carboxylmethyltransferase family protein [Candidatus Eisenbacteria bacterium]|uniref:Isoprenylcysteine carboxylmethyltransferase family protein n=1 Tax=Eiseniibacteriota bacterium TaxID=2212470 RepID=A0A933SCZ8_UNCEI|nr:isoprenylcysteine carboxylmethyltransferase family protein [Candidatus Eisenbacteria bacterium]